MKIHSKKKNNLRLIVQIIFFVLIAVTAINHSLEESGKNIQWLSSASLHAVCPFGGVVSIYQYATTGTYVKKTHESSFILMYVVFALAILFGPVFCGWICPMGSIQEWFGKIGKKIFKRNYNKFIPYKVDKYLRFIRYIVLLRVLYMTIITGKLLFAEVDPYNALFSFWTSEVSILSIVVLIIVLLTSLFIERPFCKYMCPYGAVLGLFNFIRIFKIRRVEATCISCSKCDKACPMNIEVSKKGNVLDHQCISCLKCTSEDACPVKDTVLFSYNTKPKSSIKTKFVAPIIAIVFIVGVGGSIYFNIWNTESTKVPAKYNTGEYAGSSNPADIRGSYSLQDISNSFNIGTDVLITALSLDKNTDPAIYKVKNLEEIGVIETDTVRLFVARYLGLPYTPEEGTLMTTSALTLLKDKVSDEEYEKLKENSINLKSDNAAVQDITKAEHTEIEEEAIVKGKTTFYDLLTWGLTKDQIQEVLGKEMGETNQSIRDFLMEEGLEFSEYKIKFQELLDVGK